MKTRKYRYFKYTVENTGDTYMARVIPGLPGYQYRCIERKNKRRFAFDDDPDPWIQAKVPDDPTGNQVDIIELMKIWGEEISDEDLFLYNL